MYVLRLIGQQGIRMRVMPVIKAYGLSFFSSKDVDYSTRILENYHHMISLVLSTEVVLAIRI